MMSNGTSSALNFEQELDSIPTAQGGLSRLAIARLQSAGVPVVPLLRRVGLTPEVIADPEERLSVRSQVALLDEAAIALKDDRLGFTLARDFEPHELGLLYYVMASSQTLGDALKRVARYRQTTNEALVVRYGEGNRLIISLSYSGVRATCADRILALFRRLHLRDHRLDWRHHCTHSVPGCHFTPSQPLPVPNPDVLDRTALRRACFQSQRSATAGRGGCDCPCCGVSCCRSC
jgi:hypothetical protein